MRYRFLAFLLVAGITSGCASHALRHEAAAPAGDSPVSKSPASAPTGTPPAPPVHNSFKHKVAIARFTLPVDTKAPTDTQTHATEQAKSLLEQRLQQGSRFMLLEHGLLHIPLEPKDLLVVNDESLGADYLVTGELVRHELVLPGFLDGWRNERVAAAHSEVQLQLIDAHSREVVLTQAGSSDARQPLAGDTALDNAKALALQDQALAAALEQALPTLTDTLLHRRWRSQILSAQQGYILVNSGAGQGIQVGDLFHVLPGESARMTEAAVTGDAPYLATLKVVAQAGENENELSVCELVEGRLPDERLSDLNVFSVR